MARVATKVIEAASGAPVSARTQAFRANQTKAKRAAASEIEDLIALLNAFDGDRNLESSIGVSDQGVDNQAPCDYDRPVRGAFQRLLENAKISRLDAWSPDKVGDDVAIAEESVPSDGLSNEPTTGAFDRLLNEWKARESGSCESASHHVLGPERALACGASVADPGERAVEAANCHDSVSDNCLDDRDKDQNTNCRDSGDTGELPSIRGATLSWQEEFNQARLEAHRYAGEPGLAVRTSVIDDDSDTADDEDIWYREINSLMNQCEPSDRERLTLRRKLLRPIIAATARLGAMAADSRDDTF